ncbi:MAG: helix-turn-helix domain-containing protein [Rhodospirillaceae bacterium]|nr:helix-turn-helix domain-containing protein [Rhodospirillaceae bacterium]
MKKRRKSRLERDILESMESALRYMQGLPTSGRTHVIEVPDVHGLRQTLKLSQASFAKRFGIPKRTVQDWEQGRRVPDQAAQSYLKVIARNPKAVAKALEA